MSWISDIGDKSRKRKKRHRRDWRQAVCRKTLKERRGTNERTDGRKGNPTESPQKKERRTEGAQKIREETNGEIERGNREMTVAMSEQLQKERSEDRIDTLAKVGKERYL